MHETEDELEWMQELIDRTFAGSGTHQLRIMNADRRLTARQVVTLLDGISHVAFATVDSRGRPRVSPLDALLLHGRFHVSTSSDALKVRHLERVREISAVSYRGDEYAVIVHGTASVHARDDPAVDEWNELATSLYGSSPFSWGPNVVMIRIDPDRMYAYAFHPENFAG